MKAIQFSGALYAALLGLLTYGAVRTYRFYEVRSCGFVMSEESQLFLLSDACKKRLRLFLKSQHAVSPDQLSDSLQQAFPAVKKITCAFANRKKTVVTLEAARPLFIFNDQTVLTEEERAVAVTEYAQVAVAQLPHFLVAQPEGSDAFSTECIQYARELDPAIHAFYNVEWIDSSLIKFHDKHHPQITVLGSVATKSGTLMHYSCDVLKMALLERKPARKGQKNDWCIDMRFKGQMIVFPGGKGTNEKAVCG